MRKHSRASAAEAPSGKHLVCGSGGTKAYLGGAGAILAFDFAGVDDWQTIGGVSGGSIPSLLLAAGVDPAMIVANAIDIDFSQLLVKTDSFSNVLKTRLRPGLHRGKRLRDGIVDSRCLGSLLERFVPEWPANYWTMAVAGNSMLLFTADGVFEYHGGRRRRISSTPAPVGLAVRASCAVPGVIESVRFAGRDLFDGALSPYGGCPTSMVKRH
ncbi:MAG TPA: patatin-like phospholipase family protein, partial [Candidatus Obscuribacterales bacterium]